MKNNDLNPKQNNLLLRIVDNHNLRPFFFRDAKGLHWLNPLKEQGFFNPENNPLPKPDNNGYANIPPWMAISYLVNIKDKLVQEENEQMAIIVLDIIRKATEHARRNGFGNYRTWWQFAEIIRFIPIKLIDLNDINEIVSYWLTDEYSSDMILMELGNNWLPQLLKNNTVPSKELALNLIKQLYKIEFSNNAKGYSLEEKANFSADRRDWHIKKVTKGNAYNSGKTLEKPVVEFYYELLISVLSKLNNDKWSSIWRPAIEDHSQNKEHSHSVADILVQALRDSLNGFIEKDLAGATDFVRTILNSNWETAKRIAIHSITIHSQELRDMFDVVLDKVFLKSNYRHEIWHFLYKNYSSFTPEQKERIRKIIEELEIDEEYQENAGYIAYQKQIWLSAIKDSGDNDIKIFYEECKQKSNTDPEHPDFSSYMTCGWVENKSPYSAEYLAGLSIDDLIKLLNEYVPPNTHALDRPTLEGLNEAFKDVIKIDPMKYCQEIEKFQNANAPFKYKLLESYHSLWNDKRMDLPWNYIWESVLNFCSNLINATKYWEQETTVQNVTNDYRRDWITGEIADLIKLGVENDEHAFDEKFLPKANEILTVILKHQEGVEFKEASDAVFVAINSPCGKALEALINLALRTFRLSRQDDAILHKRIWEEKFQGHFDNELMLADKWTEPAALIPKYIPNFLYMSSEWILANLSRIFDQHNYQKWLCAIQGYSYVKQIHKDVYCHLKSNGDFIKILDDKNLKDDVKEYAIHSILFFYLDEYEELHNKDSLISELFQRNNFEELKQLSFSGWMLQEDESKLVQLLKKIIDSINLNVREGKQIASHLCSWIEYIDTFDKDTMSLILKIVQFADEEHNSFSVIKKLAVLSEQHPLDAADIWIKMLEGATPFFPEDKMEILLGNIYRSGKRGEDKIKIIEELYLKKPNDIVHKMLKKIQEKSV